jgi:hypothetical protein
MLQAALAVAAVAVLVLQVDLIQVMEEQVAVVAAVLEQRVVLVL